MGDCPAADREVWSLKLYISSNLHLIEGRASTAWEPSRAGLATMLSGGLGVPIPVGARDGLFQTRPDRLWGPTLPTVGARAVCPELKRPERDVFNSLLPNAEI